MCVHLFNGLGKSRIVKLVDCERKCVLKLEFIVFFFFVICERKDVVRSNNLYWLGYRQSHSIGLANLVLWGLLFNFKLYKLSFGIKCPLKFLYFVCVIFGGPCRRIQFDFFWLFSIH